jgi:hypothetical protein
MRKIAAKFADNLRVFADGGFSLEIQQVSAEFFLELSGISGITQFCSAGIVRD